jgi:Tol biopolymer transport system component
MNKLASACICAIVLLILAGGVNAISVENVKKLDIPETDLWDVVLSPDGTQLAYIAYDEVRLQQVFVINTDGTGKKKLTEDANKKWGLAWGKDKIAYISFGNDGLEKIFVINPDGTGNAQLIPDNTRQGDSEKYMQAWGAPSWSPDGKSLVYTSLDEIGMPKMYKVNADGSGKTAVLDEISRQWSPAFSPDEKNIVYVSYPPEKYKEELFIVDIAGTARKQLTFDEIKKNYPVWGPDGTIVFVSYESVTSSGEELFAIDQDRKNRRLFINENFKQRYPSFSRDGRKFAYAAIDAAGNVKIAVGDVTGIKAETATTTPVIITAAPTPAKTAVTPAATAQTQEEQEGNSIWLIMVLAAAVMLLLVALALKDYFKK